MNNRYYKEYFKLEREHWYFRARNKIIMAHIRSLVADKQNLNILNVGVGTGHTSELLQEFGAVTSIEYDETCCQFVQETLDIQIENGSILALEYPSNTFDLVCAFDVIEHVEDDEKGVKELKRVCREDGVVVITVPAHMFLWSRHDEINHHHRRYQRPQLLELFKKEGQFIYDSYYNFWLFPPVALFRFLNNLLGITKETEEDTGSDFTIMGKDSWVTRLLYRIFHSESFFVTKHIRLPFGVSLIASWRKV
ncbi:MAG: class I SAM-dependent methyltransferase [Bacteroidota bacterium]